MFSAMCVLTEFVVSDMSESSIGGVDRHPKTSRSTTEDAKTADDMYVTLNSAAQHSPDTVWTLPAEQTLEDTPLLTSKEVAAVVDGMEEAPIPFDNVEETQNNDERLKEKENHISREVLPLSNAIIQPWQMEVKGLPWQTRHPSLMKNLTELWKRKSMCPHPHCPNGASTKQSNPTANPLIYHHWYTMHMAPGYCKIFTCELCSSVLKTKPALKTHLMKAHGYTDSNASALVRKIEIKWENLVDGKKDPTAGLPWKHTDTNSLQQLFISWKANKYSCPHHACKSRIYRPWQAVLHWYQDHMAPGYAQIYPCVLCGKPFTLVEFLRTHLSAEHELMQDIIDGMIEKITADWAKMIELKTPLTDAVVAAHLKERASDKPIPPMKLVEAPGMPWKIWCLETSRAVIAAWLLDDRGRCPHPSCNDRFKTETDVMLHWQDIHMAPDFGITYPCQHGIGSQFPCTKVFINRHDIIIHSRNEHGYSDWVIEAMLRNIESVSQKKLLIASMDTPNSKSPQIQNNHSETDSGVASSGENHTMSPPLSSDATSHKDIHSAAYLPYSCQHGLGSQYPCEENFQSKDALINHAKTVHGYNDFTLHAMIRNIEVTRNQKITEESVRMTNGHVETTNVTLQPNPPPAPQPQVNHHHHHHHHHHQQQQQQQQHHQHQHHQHQHQHHQSLPTPPPQPVLENNQRENQDKQDLQSVLWKAIVAAWGNNKKCPHPKCSSSEDNLYNEYGQMLGHWMRHHIDYSLSERTFYPCLHGQESHDLCMRVFTSAMDLKLHSVHEHHYGSEEIDVFLATLEAHVDNLTREYSENEAGLVLSDANCATEKVQTIREETYQEDSAGPAYKRRRFSEDSMG